MPPTPPRPPIRGIPAATHNAGAGSTSSGGNGPLKTIFNPTAGGNKVTPGTNLNNAIKNNPVSTAINDTIDHVKDALSGGTTSAGASSTGAGGGSTG